MEKKKKFVESGQLVSFSDYAKVLKLDDHRYYKYVSGLGFKGVDFMLIDPIGGLFLIELKNYIDCSSQPSDEESASIFYQKCEDTLHLLEIIYAYYMKKWWVRVLVLRCKLRFLLHREDKIWIDAYSLYKEGKVVLLGDFQFAREEH